MQQKTWMEKLKEWWSQPSRDSLDRLVSWLRQRPAGCRAFVIERGTVVKLGGVPIQLADDTIVYGNPNNFITNRRAS